ncbi:MAG: hypothetical protein OXE81_05300 [Gammaproteobacteria bacterium]|nr:hypothetical protein [Gammaproteobacteria bacterium]MCY4277236.1 hypothetical protein [Gammaproteobacteria bacterium]MCY4323551.1 hypothetical protein [Gammaproteobacteria bacterium]
MRSSKVAKGSQDIAQLKASLREMAMVGERADPMVFGGREHIIVRMFLSEQGCPVLERAIGFPWVHLPQTKP